MGGWDEGGMMKERNTLAVVVGILGIVTWTGCATGRDYEGTMRTESKGIVSRYRMEWEKPPVRTPYGGSVDAPLLGNGDVGVTFAGPPEKQTFYISKNDFWKLVTYDEEASPKVFGTLTVSVPALKGAGYKVEQDLYHPAAEASFTQDQAGLKMRCWLAATDNVLVIELSAEGREYEVELSLKAEPDKMAETGGGNDGEVWWAVKKYVAKMDIPTEAACAMKVDGAKGVKFAARPGKAVTIKVAMQSLFNRKDCLAVAKREAEQASVKTLWEAHVAWWENYWAKSFVEIGDPVIERHYYRSNYTMGAASRDPEFPPGLFGTWVTTNDPMWCGDYHMNYNFNAPFYGLYSSNHIGQAVPFDAPILANIEKGQWFAREVTHCRGVLFPVMLGPKGIHPLLYSDQRTGDAWEKGGWFGGQRSNAAYQVVNMTMRWRHTYDPDYARKVYPFVREVVFFWEDYLKFQDGRYVIEKDAVHEGSGENFNSIVSLALVRNAVDTALEMSEALKVDQERREKWNHILKHLSGYATQVRDGKTVFRYTERGTPWWDSNTLGIQHIFPAGQIGLESDPEALRISHNMIEVMNRWIDFNGMNSFYAAAVRVGYDPKIILDKMRFMIENHTYSNGFIKGNPHGIENCSIAPCAINEMLCMGHQKALRVFGVWPKDRDARFGNLRAEGAFLVSSELKGGRVRYVWIVSERGRDCTMVNPWPERKARVERNGRKGETVRGERFVLKTTAGEVLMLRAAE